MVSIIVFSLSWKYGVLIATSSLCLIVIIIPLLALLYNGVQCCHHKTSLADRSILFIPVPSFQQNNFPHDPEQFTEDKIQESRIKNKFVVCILIMLVAAIQFLIHNGFSEKVRVISYTLHCNKLLLGLTKPNKDILRFSLLTPHS